MSLYPVSTDRHVSFAAQDDSYDSRLWHIQQHNPQNNIPYDDSDFSFWQSNPSRPPLAHNYNTPDLPFHNFYRPTPYHSLNDFHPSSQHLSLFPPYPESSSSSSSSHRPYHAAHPSSLSPALSTASSSLSKPSSLDNPWPNHHHLYYMDDEDPSPDLHPPPPASVKAEPEDTFIMEHSAPSDSLRDNHCSSSHVPLRATHASGEMLSMMGVFRLDPFIVRGATWQQEENTGLTQSPTMFEFTLDLPDEPDLDEDEDWSLGEEEVEEPMPELSYPQRDDFSIGDYYRDPYSDYNRPVRGAKVAHGL